MVSSSSLSFYWIRNSTAERFTSAKPVFLTYSADMEGQVILIKVATYFMRYKLIVLCLCQCAVFNFQEYPVVLER